MTFNYYENKNLADTRRQQIDNEINQDVLLRSTRSHSEKTGAIYAPVLAKAGELLETLGQQLQDRYGEVPEAAIPMKPLLNE